MVKLEDKGIPKIRGLGGVFNHHKNLASVYLFRFTKCMTCIIENVMPIALKTCPSYDFYARESLGGQTYTSKPQGFTLDLWV
jgi:hypothetical protein